MVKMRTSLPGYAIVLFLCAVSSFAAKGKPRIAVSEQEFDCGTIEESAAPKISHRFVLTNTGDAPLVIKDVRTSCGCTVVRYDSVIAPGGQGSIDPEVDLRGYRGSVTKSVTVISNSENDPTLRLVLKVWIRTPIESDPQFVVITPNDSQSLITLKTEKENLSVLAVEFVPQSVLAPSKEVKQILFTFKPLGMSAKEKLYLYELHLLKMPRMAKTKYGDIVVRTNHEKKSEIKIRALTTYNDQ